MKATVSQQVTRGVALGCVMLLAVVMFGSIYTGWLRASLDAEFPQLEMVGGPCSPDVE
jgi:hypothetical protein